MRNSLRLKLLSLAGTSLIGLPCLGYAKVAPLSVHITIDKASLEDVAFTSHGLFFVKIRIKNLGNTKIKLVTWTQSGWSWVSSTSEVAPNIVALENVPTTTMLRPDRQYSYEVDLLCSSPAGKSITFKLGFVPDAELPVSTAVPGIAKSKRVTWSNAVTLHRGCPTNRPSGRP